MATITKADWREILQKDFSFLTRLAYADWLEENGEEEKAQGWRHMAKHQKWPHKGVIGFEKTRIDVWVWFTANGHRCGYGEDAGFSSKSIRPHRVTLKILRLINRNENTVYKPHESPPVAVNIKVAVEFYNRIDAEEAYVEAFMEMNRCKKRNG